MEISEWLVVPTLAVPVDSDAQALMLLQNPNYHAEQKLDGVRLMVCLHDGEVTGINRRGVPTLVTNRITEAFQYFDGTWALDGELVKGVFWVFVLPRALSSVTPRTPYGERRAILEELWPNLLLPDCVRLLPSFTDEVEKLELVQKLRAANCEGVMLKDGNAPYPAGLRTRSTRKFKFIKDVDCIVIGTNIEGKSNMALGLMTDDGDIVEVATITALAGDGMRRVGEVVTVKCLYVSDDNRLVQPTLPKWRQDKTPDECSFSQLESLKTNKEVQV